MSEETKIEWCTSTGSPWIGCTKVSPGCKNCYAETLDAQRFSRTMGGGTKEKPVSHWGKGAPRFRTKGFWKDAVKWNKQAGIDKAEAENFGVPFVPPRIFPSLCDWLDDEVPILWLADFIRLIRDTPNLDWLLLTKRPELFNERLQKAQDWDFDMGDRTLCGFIRDWRDGTVLPDNVWIGTSVEDQQRADERIPALLKIPDKIRFLSVEPLLGRVEINKASFLFHPNDMEPTGEFRTSPITGKRQIGMRVRKGTPHRINWVIVGGESGKGARACNIEWVRSIAEQCKAAGVPCFVKQLGAFCKSDTVDAEYLSRFWPTMEYEVNCGGALYKLKHSKGGDPEEWPEDLRVREFPVLQ